MLRWEWKDTSNHIFLRWKNSPKFFILENNNNKEEYQYRIENKITLFPNVSFRLKITIDTKYPFREKYFQI